MELHNLTSLTQNLNMTRLFRGVALGAKFPTIRQWRYRNIPTRWQLKLIKHFGAMIVIDDVASADLPPVRQRTLADICREKFLTPSGLS